jgi:SpoVK/Ycf46/Vps4 family AAA+-type ATPase
VSSYLGETAANLRKVFEFARSRPLVLLFDEFDAIGKHRTAFDEHGELKRVVNSFLQLLDGFRAETLTVAATNHQGLLDSALWRRFDEIVLFPKPTREEIETLFCRQFRQLTVSHSLRLTEVAGGLEGLTHADVERVAQDAIKQTLLGGQEQIEVEVLDAAVARQRERIAVTEASTGTEEQNPQKSRPRRKKSD